MRWGVRDEATDDHMTTELCMKEIENCQRLSMGPNFVVKFKIYLTILVPCIIHLYITRIMGCSVFTLILKQTTHDWFY